MADFLWGVATASYQVEGGLNGPREPLNNWAPWDVSHRVEPVRQAVSFWAHPGELIGRAADIGCNAFRLSIEWARVQPSIHAEVGAEPEWDAAALDRYADICMNCRKIGMEPIVTLFHFTHPMWLGEHFWLDAHAPTRFAKYAKRCITELNTRLVSRGQEPLHWLITINEPAVVPMTSYVLGIMPPGVRDPRRARVAHEHIVAAHVMAYDAIHDAYEENDWTTPLVSTNTIAWSAVAFDAVVTDALLARERGVRPTELRSYLNDCADTARKRVAAIPRRDRMSSVLDTIVDRAARAAGLQPTGPALHAIYHSPRAKKLDYISFDYYDPIIGHFAGMGPEGASEHRSVPFVAELWDQLAIPEGLEIFLKQAHEQAPDKQILIAENGMATPGHDPRADHLQRPEFLRDMTDVVLHARDADKLPIAGYIHWTLTDNYEWGSYKPAFGLYGVKRSGNSFEILDTDAVGVDSAAVFREIVAGDR